MKILAIDSSGLTASAALAEEGRLIGSFSTNTKMTHSVSLLPMVDTLLRQTGVGPEEIGAVAAAAGPGSFTGLRIGCATVKGLALAWDVPVIGVPTVDALAWNVAGAEGLVCPILDARRQQTYTGIYAFTTRDGQEPGIRMEILRQQCATTIEELVQDLNRKREQVTFLGDGVPVFSAYIRENLRVPYRFAPEHMRLQNASSVASLALVYAAEGKFTDGAMFRPIYLRETQAERERREGK